MFKIESYITPIILNYVAKYVKNIRPQDSQVSLWEGEVLFQNLDLRLDVLEEELNLPFEFLSGHIHELSIQVPWTKLTSEPIRIVINTIEFVLKLKKERGDGASPSGSSSPQRSRTVQQRPKRLSNLEEQQQQSTGMGLVNKIINNIVVQCHNIILKYVEEDIVVSMNVQLLSLSSADERWRPTMADVHPMRVLMRKLVQISDLTICLDKRNAAGQIEVCQEPILYRCTLECRILRKYNTSSLATTSTTRIGVYTKSLDINVSSLQFPMIMRVIKLLLALKSGKIKSTSPAEVYDEELEEQDTVKPVDDSYLAWAWNLLPSFNFQSLEEEEQADAEQPGHTLDLGVYVEQFNFTLKHSEFVNDSIMGTTKRIRYTPILRAIVGGMYFEIVSVQERNWSSTKAGLSSIFMEPLGPYRGENTTPQALIETQSFKNLRTFIDKSLFDEQYLIVDKGWGVSNYEEYSTHITDEYLLYRSPILAIDMVEYKTAKCEGDANSRRDAPPNDMCMQYRLLSSGITFRYSQTLLQVNHVISELVDSYDYPAYYAEQLNATPSGTASGGTTTKLHPPIMEDYDALMQYIPLRSYKFVLKNISVEIHPMTEPEIEAITAGGQKPQRRQLLSAQQPLPFFAIRFEQADGFWRTPLQPDKLVHTTCQLPNKPRELLHACYDNYECDLRNCSLSLLFGPQPTSRHVVKLLDIPGIHVAYGSLIQPQLWQDETVPQCKLRANCGKLNFQFTKRDLIVSQRVLNAVLSYHPQSLLKAAGQLAASDDQKESVHLQIELQSLELQMRRYKFYSIWNAALYEMQAQVVQRRRTYEERRYVFLRTSSKQDDNKCKWLEWQAQFATGSAEESKTACRKGKPLKSKELQIVTCMALWVDCFNIYVDANLLEFFKYNEELEYNYESDASMEVELHTQSLGPQISTATTPPVATVPLPFSSTAFQMARRSSRTTQPSRKVSHPEETIHFSSERDEKVQPNKPPTVPRYVKEEKFDWVSYFKELVLLVEISHVEVHIAEVLQRSAAEEIICEYTQILLPKIMLKSTHSENFLRSNMLQKICVLSTTNLNWTVVLQDLAMYNRNPDVNIMAPTQTSITVALTQAKEVKFTDRLDALEQGKMPTTGLEIPVMGKEDLSSLTKLSAESGEENCDSNESFHSEQDKTPSKKDKNYGKLRDIVTINLHADTTSIRFFVSTQMISVLHKRFSVLMNVLNAVKLAPQSVDCMDVLIFNPPLKVLTATEEDPSIKEFLELETNSTSSQVSDDRLSSKPVITVFCQWSIAKVIFELKNTNILQESKMLLELEDLLSTVDKREDFVKYTSKVGNFSLNYYLKTNERREWQLQECIRIRLLGDSGNLPFFNVIVTCVGLKSFFQRIQAKRNGDLNRSISEVLVTIEAIEMIVNLEKLAEFLAPICANLERACGKQAKPQSGCPPAPLTTADLPLIHFNSKGFALYLPLDTAKESCSVIMWKIENIKITPNVDNPLQRYPLRADVFGKAAQMGILDTPGSIVEDRQYELTLKNISATTGDWLQVLANMREQANSFRTNPAFEWNNQNQKPSLQLAPIFSNFKFMAIFAPCIAYNNILICGQAMEFNCAADFVASLNLHQLNLLSCITLRLRNISEILRCACMPPVVRKVPSPLPSPSPSQLKSQSLSAVFYTPENGSDTTTQNIRSRSSKSLNTLQNLKVCEKGIAVFKDLRTSASMYDSIEEDAEQHVKTDSGFQSSISHSQSGSNKKPSLSTSVVLERRDNHMPEAVRLAPHTLSLVAGIFILKLYDLYAAEEKDAEPVYQPLISCTISQPSFMFTQNVFDSVTQASLFSLGIHMSQEEVTPRKSNIFPAGLLETQQGELSATGIPPPVLSFKSHCTKLQLREVDVEIMKPLSITISEENCVRLCKYLMLIYDALLAESCLSACRQVAVPRGTKIGLLKQQCFQADRLNCKCHRILIRFASKKEDYSCKLVCADLRLNVKFLTRPEKATMKASIGTFYLKTLKKIFIHPIALCASVDLVSEPWHNLPLVIATLKLNIVHMDVGIYGLVQLRRILQGYERISKAIEEEYAQFLRKHRATDEEMVPREYLQALKCPSLCSLDKQSAAGAGKYKIQREEFYQDDLRAGAFQFVELMTDTFLPLPYQIQIIKKNFGIICWRYPQPRKMCKIHIYPVPMAVPNPIHIMCRMEYFSEAHQCFLHYYDFWLSETVSKQVPLPELEVCANIWRVVILQSLVSVNGDCFENSEDDTELCSITSVKIEDVLGSEGHNSEFILHPKVLVGCMRIDTSFQSRSVPKVQLLFSCNMLQVKLLNQPNENVQLPKLLKKFRLAENTDISQSFLVCLLENISFHAAFHERQHFTLNSSLSCSIKCVDFGYLNMLHLLEQTTVQSHVRVNRAQRELVANFVLDKFRINIGPSAIHTLLSSKAHWEELLDQEQLSERHAFISKCIVVNRTYSRLCFGQTGTNERIQLQPKECHMYSFRSDYHNQELTFFIADDATNIMAVSQSVPIPFKFEGESMLQPIRIGNRCIIVKSKKLSSSQIYVLVKGQIEMISMVRHDLRLEFRSEGREYNEKQLLEYPIDQWGRGTFFRTVHRNLNVIMRLRFANNKTKGRSGDIPLRTNKNLPWLVKVPTTNNQFISFWVRVLREDIPELSTVDFQPQKLLITIWPIFLISSLLPIPVSAVENTNFEKFSVAAEGGRYVLNVPATHVTEHTVEFDFGFPLGRTSKRNFTFSLKSLDWNNFFWYDEQRWHLEYALKELAKGAVRPWPLNDEEELRLKRNCSMSYTADVIYRTRPVRDFSCALCLEIAPWSMFINATGQAVSICDYETNDGVIVEPNCLEMLHRIKTAFTVNIPNGSNWITSLPIYYQETAASATGRCYVLAANSSLDVVILRGSEVFKFVLELRRENEGMVFRLRSKIAVANFTKRKLCVLSFAMDHKEQASHADVYALDQNVPKLDLDFVRSLENCIGLTLDSFYDLNARKTQRSNDTAFVCFVCLKICEESGLSIPIPLSLPFTRRCFSIQNENDSVPLLVTLIEKEGIYYLNIFEDVTPAILVNNLTDVKFIIAQTSASENSKVSNTTPEYLGRHFEWYQLLPAFSKCYYTPPEMYASFPDVEFTMCNLTLALYKENCTKKTIKWSKPLRTDKTWSKFLHVPNHGDVKVNICDKHRVIRVSIYYIAQPLEFSVKDLRSRLLTPHATTEFDRPSQASIATVREESTPNHELQTLPQPQCIHFLQDCETKMQWHVRFFVKELVLSLHTDAKERDNMKCEIFGLCVDDMLLAYDDDDDQRQLHLLLPNLQIDNQLYTTGKYDFPVVLCAQELYPCTQVVPQVHYLERTYQALRRGSSMASFTVGFFEDELKISSIVCRISPVRAYIEDAYLNDLLEALVECEPSNCVYRPKQLQARLVLSAGAVLLPRDVTAQAICIAEPLQLRSFRIEPLDVLLSVHTSVRMYIALDHSPLSFSAYERKRVLTVPLRFGQSVGMHFLSGAIFGAGWVVGSLEILGSPSGLARSFSTGLRDFVSMPMRGLFSGPWGFVVGITQGSASLLRNVTAGTVNSVTKLASSVARNLDRLSLDQEHIERTEALRRSRPHGFAEGLSQGMTGLGISILGAVGGLAHHTLEARSPTEVVTGMGKGLVGAFTKPISGAAELLALAGQGMLYTVGFNAMPQQRSPAVCQTMAVEPADFRIWRLLPAELMSDQILFYCEVSLIVRDQLRRAYIFLTSAVLAIMESQWDKLALVTPVEKVELIVDRDDKTLLYVTLVKDNDGSEEDMNYTNERIMQFLRTSASTDKFSTIITTDSLDDLLQAHTQHGHLSGGGIECAFYINEHLGEHLIQYLSVINERIS